MNILRICLLHIFALLTFTCNLKAQKADTVIGPSREWTLFCSGGKTSLTHFNPDSGPVIFVPNRNSILNFGVMRAYCFNNYFKIAIGVKVGITQPHINYAINSSRFTEDSLLSAVINKNKNYHNQLNQQSWNSCNVEFPVELSYKLFSLKNTHSMWISAGLGLQKYLPVGYISSLGYPLDSLNSYHVFSNSYSINGNRKLNWSGNFGLIYNLSFKNNNHLNLGLIQHINSRDILTGTYSSFNQSSMYNGTGKISSNFGYTGVEVSYSFNDRLKTYRMHNALKNTGMALPKDIKLPDKFELRIPFEFLNTPAVRVKQKTGENKPQHYNWINGRLHFGPEFHKYIDNTFSVYSGISINFQAQGYKVSYSDKNLIKPGEQITVEIDEVESQYLKIPLGFSFHKQSGKSSDFEISADLNLNYSFSSINYSRFQIGLDISPDTTIWIYDNYKILQHKIFPGTGLHFGYAITLRNYNKIIISSNSFIALGFDSRKYYKLVQSDLSIAEGTITSWPTYTNLSIAYCITWKRWRWLKENSY